MDFIRFLARPARPPALQYTTYSWSKGKAEILETKSGS